MSDVITSPPPPLSHTGDTFCGVACALIIFLGLLGNIPAAVIFCSELRRKNYINEKKLFFDILFVFISVTDILTCISLIPVAASFFRARDPRLFTTSLFCKFWGVMWTIIPYFSVFLVAMLSITRFYMLIRPLSRVNCKVMVGVLLAYLLFLVLRSVVPLLTTSYTTYYYYPDTAICMEAITELNTYWHFKMYANQIQLLLPIVPVTVSSLLSLIVLSKRRQARSRVARMQAEATSTILLVTLLYWVCNVPVVINYIFFYVMRRQSYTYREMYGTVFMYWYSWPLTLVMSVGLNSLLNPVVYFTRMKRYRTSVRAVMTDSAVFRTLTRINIVHYTSARKHQDTPT